MYVNMYVYNNKKEEEKHYLLIWQILKIFNKRVQEQDKNWR